jgi:hypothetical protein
LKVAVIIDSNKEINAYLQIRATHVESFLGYNKFISHKAVPGVAHLQSVEHRGV